MDTFSKENLRYEYRWSRYEKGDPRIYGVPDSTAFDKKEGEEVFYIINYLTEHVAWDVGNFGSKVERLIHDHLPEEITDQQDAVRWVREHWKKSTVEQEGMKVPEAA